MYSKRTAWFLCAVAFVLALQGLPPSAAVAQKDAPTPPKTVAEEKREDLEARKEAVGRALRTDKRLLVAIDLEWDECAIVEAVGRVQKATGVVLSVDKNLQGSNSNQMVAVNIPAWEIMADMAAIDVQDGSWEKVDGGYRLIGKARPSEGPIVTRPRRTIPAFATDFEQVFRDGKFDTAILQLAGSEPDKYIHREAEGLRITLPAGTTVENGVGVALRLPVHGDCTLTAAFTILQSDPPKSGNGSGVILQVIKKNGEGQDIAAITRTCRPAKGEAFVANWSSKQGDKPVAKLKDFASQAKSGRLRLMRQGAVLHFLIAEGSQDPFREIFDVNFGSEDIRTVRLVADTRKANNLLDVRLESLSLQTTTRASKPVEPVRATVKPDPNKPPAPTPTAASTGTVTPAPNPPTETPAGASSSSTGMVVWIAASLVGGVLILLVGCLVGGWLWLGKRGSTS
jgi:hypothetical protein